MHIIVWLNFVCDDFRHYQTSNNQEPDFQRQKTGSDYNNSNGPDCNVVTPRRPSPLQAHSQASPIGHAQSPVYPMYNSPLNSISSPQQPNSTTQVQPPSPLDVSVPRPNSQTGSVAYPSVITRALNTDKGFTEQRYERTNQQPQQGKNHFTFTLIPVLKRINFYAANQQQNCWDERQPQLQRKFQNQPPTPVSTYNSIEVASRPGELPTRVEPQQRGGNQLGYFEAGHQVTLQDLSSCRGDPMSIVKNLQQQQGCQVAPQPEVKQEVKAPSKRRKSNEKANSNPPSEIPSKFNLLLITVIIIIIKNNKVFVTPLKLLRNFAYNQIVLYRFYNCRLQI